MKVRICILLIIILMAIVGGILFSGYDNYPHDHKIVKVRKHR